MLLLVIGCIVVLILHFEYPRIGASHPANIECGQDSIISVDLGVDPFWLESASFTIVASLRTRGTVYIVKSSCSSTSTIVTWNDTLSDYPNYLVTGSSINITNKENETIKFWVISQAHQSPITNPQCEELDTHKCERHPNSTLWCQQVNSSETITHDILFSDYFDFCAKGLRLSKSEVTATYNYSLKNVSYNKTTIAQQCTASAKIGSATPTTVPIPHQHFDFRNRDFCVFLDLSSCGGKANYPLSIQLHRRIDFLLFPLLVTLILCTLHIIISTVVIKRCCLLKARVSKDYCDSSTSERSLLLNKQ